LFFLNSSKPAATCPTPKKPSKWHPAVGVGVFFDVFGGFSGFNFSVWKGREDFTFLFSSGFEF